MAHVDEPGRLRILARMETRSQEKPYHTIGRWGRGRVRPIALSPRDLDYLLALFTLGVLSSDMLRALVAPQHSQRVTADRLFLLKNPPNEYIVQPEAQQRARGADCAHLVFEIGNKGSHALVDSGRITYEDYVLWQKAQVNFKPQHFDHDRAAGYVLASVVLGARETGVRFIPWCEILNRPRCPARARESQNPLAIPYEVNGERHALIPDALFGLQYAAGACFFALEIDMGTEQHKDSDAKSVTLRQKFRAYRAVMRDRLHASQFGLPSLYVLMVTPGVLRLRNMMEHVGRVFDGAPEGQSARFLFKAMPALAPINAHVARPTGHMLRIPWDRFDHPQLNLSAL
jgi:hypothetical protein